MEQCKLPISFEGEPRHTAYCIKDLGHEDTHVSNRHPNKSDFAWSKEV